MTGSVAVVVAAWNAAATIAKAVRSALDQPEVRRVVVVDDGSSDDTLAVAMRTEDPDGRLHPIRLEANVGPARARNIGIAAAAEEFVAVLDADDFFLPGRLSRLFAAGDWDLAADNIAFVRGGGEAEGDEDWRTLAARAERAAPLDPAPRDMTFTDFVEGNLSVAGRPRGELGFLKPVVRRALLGAAPYDETLRLGEDYALYARLLADGARFRLIRTCGYVALVRGDSLSGRHSAADLERFTAVDEALAHHPRLDAAARRAVRRHQAQSRGRFEHRRFLKEKSEQGALAALLAFAGRPAAWRPVALGIAGDKLRAPPPVPDVRFLLSAASPAGSISPKGPRG